MKPMIVILRKLRIAIPSERRRLAALDSEAEPILAPEIVASACPHDCASAGALEIEKARTARPDPVAGTNCPTSPFDCVRGHRSAIPDREGRMKRIFLLSLPLRRLCRSGAPLRAEPSWQPLPRELASAETRQSLMVPVGGHRYREWQRQSFGSLLMFPPALAALVLRSFVPAPRQSYRQAVRPEPVSPYTGEAAPPAQQAPPAGSSTPWVDPDEPAR